MSLALAAAAAFSAGLLLLYRAARPPRAGLAEALAVLLAPASAEARTGAPGPLAPARRRHRLVEALAAPAARSPRLRGDLRVAEVAAARLVVQAAGTATLFATLAAALAAAVALGGTQPPVGLVVAVVLVAAVGGAVVPFAVVRGQAAARRGELVELLPGYLDLVGVELAAGQALPAALRHAAGLGTGWGYRQLAEALARAARIRQSAGEALAGLAAELAVEELAELAVSLTVAETTGAALRATLAAQAGAARERRLAAAETRAGKATESMAFPLALLVAGFVVLIGYPALIGLAGGLGAS